MLVLRETMIRLPTANKSRCEISPEFTSSSMVEVVTTRSGAYGEESDQNDVVSHRNIPENSFKFNDDTKKKKLVEKNNSNQMSNHASEIAINGCDQEQTERKVEASIIDYSYLDWNKVFYFLANQLDAVKCPSFFNVLYGNTSNRGEVNSKNKFGMYDTVTLLVEQFKAWKEFAGKDAKHITIAKSLQELNLNDTFNKFRRFMCDPPMLPNMCEGGTHTDNDFRLTIDPKQDFIPFSMNQPPQVHFKRCHDAMEERSYCEETDKAPENKGNNFPLPKWSDLLPMHHTKWFLSTQMGTKYDNCKWHEETFHLRNESKGSNLISPFKSRLTNSSFRLLVQNYVQSGNGYLRQDMYQLVLRDTVLKVMTETDKSENIVLSLTFQDFLDADKMKTKRETIVVMYSNETRLVFGESAFSDLSFYAEHARKQVVDKLGENHIKEDTVFLFLDYNGKRISSKIPLRDETEKKYFDEESVVDVQDSISIDIEED